MKYLKLFIFCFILFLFPNVFALEYNVSNSITSPVSPSGSGTYTGEEQNGSTSSWNINTRYNGTLQRIRFNIPVPASVGECFSTNMNYTITMNMATSDWRNRFGIVRVVPYSSSSTNWSNGHVTFVSMKKIYFTFKIPSSDTTCYQSVYVDLPSNATFTPFTGETNWNLSSVILTDELSSGGSGSGSGSGSGGGSTSSNQDIIDNSNQNTQSLIENQTNNTNNIIDNSNQNTTDIINNQNDNTTQITNAIDNVNNQLGSCINNILNSFYDVVPYYNIYLGDDKIAYQIQPDNYTTSRTVKVMLFGRSGRIEDLPYQSLRTGRFNFSFTYNTNITSLVFGLNGQNIDTLIKLNLESFNLDDGSTYTLSFTIKNATDGSSSFNNFSLVKGEYISNVSIPYGEGICTSKLDSFISTANQNTTDIINNQNQNTQDIINNQNQNTQQEIESQKVCKIYDSSNISINGKFFGNNGNLYIGGNGEGVSDYINIENSTLTNIKNTGTSWIYSCFYNSSKSLISCIRSSELLSNDNIPTGSVYVRFGFIKNSNTNSPVFKICKNGNQSLTDSLTDSSVDNGVGSDFFNDFEDNSHGLTGIITAPLTAIQRITSSTCQPLTIPIPFTNGSVNLPCMTEIYEQNIPTIYNIWKIVSFGIIAYFICVDIFHIVKGFKDPETDKVEVLDL